ncbi:hypothetical protein HU200_021617 [Digitaria exilis]|uniref:Uncharacterized protein n=1 Tax=Digitaria exilis TaxID=1010633 RepID=A0A835EZF7_9POAL|nr:hypothetical protein HU200_021617 [Digitaria exilis]
MELSPLPNSKYFHTVCNIGRAMETVVNQHGIDMEALRSSRIPFAGGPQAGDSSGASMSKDKEVIGNQSPMIGSDASLNSGQAGLWQFPSGSSDMIRHGASISGRVPAGPNRGDFSAADIHQGSMSQKSGRSSGIESPASLQMEDTRSMNSHDSLKSDEKTSKKTSSKRKRMDSKGAGDLHSEDNSKSDAISAGQNTRKGKQVGQTGRQGQASMGMEHEQPHSVQGGTAQVPQLHSSTPFLRANPEGPLTSSGRTIDNTKPSNPFTMTQIPNFPEGLASSGVPIELQKSMRGSANLFNAGFGWNQNPQVSIMKNSQGPIPNLVGSGVNVEGKVNVGAQGAFNSTSAPQMGFATIPPYSSSSFGGSSQFLDKGKELASGSIGSELHSTTKVASQPGIPHVRSLFSLFLILRDPTNNLQPRKVHLEIALGRGPPAESDSASQRGSESRVADGLGKENGSSRENSGVFCRQSDLSRLPSTSAGSIAEVDSFPKDPENATKKIKVAEQEKSMMELGNIQQASVMQGTSSEMRSHETASPIPSGPQQSYFQGDTRRVAPDIHRTDGDNLNRNLSWGGLGPTALAGNRQHLNQETKGSLAPSKSHHIPVDGYNSNMPGIDQTSGAVGAGNDVENSSHVAEIVPEQTADEGEDDLSEHDDLPSSPPKHTVTEKWILDYQKRIYNERQKRTLEQHKLHSKMSASYEKLKESVNSSEDLSAKTKSVIELKKLQLLPLQRRVRREKLEDSFKVKRERLKGFNRYVKEFHKRKERIHREKLDRIQREKINLLKNNDVEGYLRMVQDAKSDRVKQLLRETEKYLQKLGAKLQNAKSTDGRASNVLDKSDPANDIEDESYQPQHYLESNEKYYKLAHREMIVHQKFNVLLTTYEYLMNKHDRPKLSKIQWHYIIIDEGHRIKNASCKLNADLKLYRSSHRLLLTGTPLQVENELPEKIERLVRCEASAYQKLLMKRVEENLGGIGAVKVRSVHNSVMELRNICNHPYLSQLHVEEIEGYLPKHFLPSIVRLCGKLEMLDRLLPKLKATGHRVLLFSTMTRLLDVMEDYLVWKKYKYLRLDGHTSGHERGALIDKFNDPNSQAFIFLLSIRAGGVGVNLQAADTVIIFDTDWNPQVDLQAQARAHRIGQKKEVLVLRLETVRTVEEQVRASAEHKLGVANQSITAGFFDNNTSAEDRREYLESLLRECKKEEAAPVLDDDALNDILARSEAEIDVFESIDKQRREAEMAAWQKVVQDGSTSGLDPAVLPSRLVTDDDLEPFCHAMKLYEPSNVKNVKVNVRKKGALGGLDTQHYGRGKRAREVRSYEDQWTEEEFEKLCQVDSPESPQPGGMLKDLGVPKGIKPEIPVESSKESEQMGKETSPTVGNSPQAKRRRGRPKRSDIFLSPTTAPTDAVKPETGTTQDGSSATPATIIHSESDTPATPIHSATSDVNLHSISPADINKQEFGTESKPSSSVSVLEGSVAKEISTPLENAQNVAAPAASHQPARGRKAQAGETPRRRGRKPKSLTSPGADDVSLSPTVLVGSGVADTSRGSSYAQVNMPPSQGSAMSVAGIQKDLDAVKLETLLPDSANRIAAVHEGDKGTNVTASLAKDLCAGTVMSDNTTTQAPNTPNENVGLLQVATVPTVPMVSEGISETSHVAVADIPVEKQGASRRRRKKTSGSEDTGVSTRQRSAMKKAYYSTSVDEVGSGITTSEKSRITKERDGSSFQDSSNELPNINLPLHEKSGYDSQPSTPIAVPIDEATLPSSFNDTSATDSKNSGRDAIVVPSEIDSVAPNKASSRRRKGSSREPRNRSVFATAASERRGRLTGSKQADIKKLEISAGPAVCVSSVEQQGADSLRVEVTTASVSEAQKNSGSRVSSDISIPVGSHVPGPASTEETIPIITHTPSVAKSEERKLPEGTEANSSELTKVVSAAEPAPANDEHMQGIEVDSSERPTKIVSAAESAPSNDEEHTANEVHLKTADVNMLTSSTTTEMLQDKIGSSAAYQSGAPCKEETTSQSDASLQDSKVVDALARCPPGSIKDDNASHSEGTSVNAILCKQDDMKIDDTQADDASRVSSSHLTANLQSTESDQPPDQEEILESTKERVKMEETLDKSSSDNQTPSRGSEMSPDITLVRNSSENLNECSAHVDGDTLKMKDDIAEVPDIMYTDGPEVALDASSTQYKKEAIMADGSTKGDTVETNASMNADGPEEAQGASSTQSDKEASVAVVDISTGGSPTVCIAHNDLEGQVSFRETLDTAGGDNQTHCNTNDDSSNKNEDTMVNPVDTCIDDSENKIEESMVNPVDSTREPIGESTISVSENPDLNKQSCTLHFGNDPPASTLATVQFNEVTGDAEILFPSRLESSGIDTETVDIQETAVADLERTGDLDNKTSNRDAVLGTSRSIGVICEKTSTEDLTACSHSEAPSSIIAVEPTQKSSVADTVVFMDTCNTEPCGDSTNAEGEKLTVEVVHTNEEQSAVPEHAEAQTKPTAICGPMLNEYPQTAGLEDQCSLPKHSGPTSELVLPPNPIGETSAIQVEPEAIESGYCTAEGGRASSETVMELEPNKETVAPMQEDIAEANDAESFECSDASLEMHSSEIKAASSINSSAGSLSTQTPALPDGAEQVDMPSASGVAPANDEHMQVSEVNSSGQPTKMVSPANDEHVQDIMVHSSEQQTRMLSAAEFDTLCVQETAIIDHCGATETVNLNEKSSLLGAEAYSSEQKIASSPGDDVNSSEQTKIDLVTEIGTADVNETAIADGETQDVKETDMADDETVDIKETAIADHEETGHKSGRSVESEVHYSEQIKMVSAVEPASGPGCHMHGVHHTVGDGAILSSEEQDTLRDSIGSGANVDLSSQRKTSFEGDKDQSAGINVESTQGPCDASGNDYSTDPAATNLLAESVNDTCDAEIGGKLESSGGSDIGTIGAQEVADVANVEGTRGIGIEDYGSEQMKMTSVAQVASNVVLVGYSSSEDSMLEDPARAADGGDFVDSKAGVDGQEATSTQTASTLAENTDMDWQSCPVHSANESPAMIESDKDTGDVGIPCVGKIESSSGVGNEMMGVQETSIADQQGKKGTSDLNEENGSPQRDDGCGTSCSKLIMASEKASSDEVVTVVVHSEVPTSVELVTAKPTEEATISHREETILYEKATSGEEPTVGSCSDAPTSAELVGVESTQEANVATASGADRLEVVKAAEEEPTEICGPMQEETIRIENLESDVPEPKDGSPITPSERVAEPKQIDETCVMQVELVSSAGDGCAADDHKGVSSEIVMESEPVQEIVVPMQEDGKEGTDAGTVCEDLEDHAPGDVLMPIESEITVPMQESGSEANDTTTVSEVCEGTKSHVSEHEGRSMAHLDAVADDLPVTVGGESTPGGANANFGVADTEQKLLSSSGEAMVYISSEPPNQVAEESSSADRSGNGENGKMEEAAATQGPLHTDSHGSENVKLDEADNAMQLPHSSGEETMVDRCSEPPSNEVKESPSIDPSMNIEDVKTEEANVAQGLVNSELAHGGETDTELQLPFSSGEPMVDTCSELPSQDVNEAPISDPLVNNEILETENATAAQDLLNIESTACGENAKHDEADTEEQLPPSGEAMVDITCEVPIQVQEAPSTDLPGNDEDAKMVEASTAQGLLNTESVHGGENAKHGEAVMDLQLPPSVDAMVEISSELVTQEVKEAVNAGPSENHEDAKMEEATAAAHVLLNAEPAPSGEASKLAGARTEVQLPSSGEAVLDMPSELSSCQEVTEAPSIDTLGNDENAKMEEATIAHGMLNTGSAHGGENAKLDEAGMELQLPPSGDTMVEISSELVSQEVKEAASPGPSGNDENAKMEEGTAAAHVLLNAEPAPSGEASRLAGVQTEQPPSGEAMLDVSSEPSGCQEVKEAPRSDTLGNDENSMTEKTAAAGGENTELGEAETEEQAVLVSAEVIVESSSELPSQEVKETTVTDLSGDDEKAKSTRAAVVAELFGDTTEGALDQPLESPRGQGEDADADEFVE